MRRTCVIVLALLLFPASRAGGDEKRALRLATTTSTENSGLLKSILPGFEKRFGIEVHVIAVGTGRALKLGANGDVDLVMVHAPAAELAFVEAGHGVNRRPFMKNDFVIAGPADDPAGLKGKKTIAGALARLTRDPKAVFISRGDDSGTHKKELSLWKAAGLGMPSARYLEIGQGMEAALRMADEKRAYTLADRGTYLALKDSLDLIVVFEKDQSLDNPYAVIAVNPARYPDASYIEAMILIAWLTSPEGQKLIGEFKVHGEVLFYPTAATDN